jgi:hypothetical protein
MFPDTRVVDGSPAAAVCKNLRKSKQPYRSKLSGVAARQSVVALHPTLALGHPRHILRLRNTDPIAL